MTRRPPRLAERVLIWSVPEMDRDEAQEIAGNDHVAVISDALWRRRFGSDPTLVGKTMTFETGVWEIVGVMPAGFTFPIGVARDMWIPYVVPPNDRIRGNSQNYYLQVIGRLKRDVTVERAQIRLEQINGALAQRYPAWFKNRTVVVRNLRETVVGNQVRSWMLMLLGAVGLVMLIACVNVACLMLAHATGRSREMSTIPFRAAKTETRYSRPHPAKSV